MALHMTLHSPFVFSFKACTQNTLSRIIKTRAYEIITTSFEKHMRTPSNF